MTIRMAILAGVSSDVQANEGKESIPDQIKTCRRVIEHHKGIETACYVFDGYSRSGYDSLSDAMNDIPPLKEAIEAAEKNKYDVLLLDSWDRLGDLGQLVYTRFRKHKKQIYSARQSGQMYDPATYDPTSDESGGINMHVQAIIQTYRINKIRRGWSLGVPARVNKGLHALRIPFGYRLTGKDQPAQIVPEQAALLIKMAGWMLEGQTYTEIAKRADEILPPAQSKKWTVAAVHRSLVNPFLAGIIRFGVMNKRKKTPHTNWKIGKGKHEPLWDEQTYYALISEAKRRMEGKRNFAAKYPFTGLTWCGVCGAKVNKHGKQPYEYFACNKSHEHFAMHYKDVPAYLADKVVRGYEQYQAQPRVPVDLAPYLKRLSDVQSLRAQIQSDREVGIYTQAEAVVKINKLVDDEEETKRYIEQVKEREQMRVDWDNHRGELLNLRQSIHTEDPQKLNRWLTALIDRITLAGNDTEIVWRE